MTWGWWFCNEEGELKGTPSGRFEDEEIVFNIIDKFAREYDGANHQCDRIWFANDRIILRNSGDQKLWCFVRID